MFDDVETRPARGVRLLFSPWARLALLLALLGTGAALLLSHDPRDLLTGTLAHQFTGSVAVAVFALAYGVCTAAFVPRPVLNLLAGALFGSASGLGAAVAGSVLGAGLAFGLGRVLGQDALRPLLRTRWLRAADGQLSAHGFRTTLALRLFPGLPYWGVNYCAAVARTRWLPFLLATAIGVVPNTAAYVIAGSRAATPGSPVFLLAAGFVVVTALAGGWIGWRRRHRMRGNGPDEEETRELVGASGRH
ncbi:MULTISPECIES: TVP38/TMEM64 family protein [unclassified Streptomyces]|uniref:TVP38/TMEM64 family protein n=1 Tax=unclassified Streptomyces TaxID=2593676 RepID=UPI000A8543F7